MTKDSMPLAQKHDEGDFLRAVAEAVLQLLMEHDVEGVIGAGRHERSAAADDVAVLAGELEAVAAPLQIRAHHDDLAVNMRLPVRLA